MSSSSSILSSVNEEILIKTLYRNGCYQICFRPTPRATTQTQPGRIFPAKSEPGRIFPAKSEPDLSSNGTSSTYRSNHFRAQTQHAPVTRSSRVPRSKSPPPVKPVSIIEGRAGGLERLLYFFLLCEAVEIELKNMYPLLFHYS